MNSLWMLLLGVIAIVVVVSAISAGRRNDTYPAHRPDPEELPSDRPVFLGHDKRWTPSLALDDASPEESRLAEEKVSQG